jgi:hypothetical protein
MVLEINSLQLLEEWRRDERSCGKADSILKYNYCLCKGRDIYNNGRSISDCRKGAEKQLSSVNYFEVHSIVMAVDEFAAY